MDCVEVVVECLECRYRHEYEVGERCLWLAKARRYKSMLGEYLSFKACCPECGSTVVVAT